MTDVVKRLAILVLAVVCGDVAGQESAPTFHLHIDGAADSSRIRVEYMLRGPFGGSGHRLRGSADIHIPLVVDGQPARSLRALVFCPGYRIARVEIPDVAAQTDLSVALDALATRHLNGKIEFAGGVQPRSFILDIEVQVGSSHKFFEIVDGPVTEFDVAEAVVSAAGEFSVVVPELAEDEALQSPGLPSMLRFLARDAATGNFVFDLMPRQVAIDDLPQTLALSASPAR